MTEDVTAMDNDIFEEIEHWLNFIKRWEKENKEPVPETALDALELALEKAVAKYKEEKFVTIKPGTNTKKLH